MEINESSWTHQWIEVIRKNHPTIQTEMSIQRNAVTLSMGVDGAIIILSSCWTWNMS